MVHRSITDDRIMGLVERLRAAGLAVPVTSTMAFVEALTHLTDDPISIHRAARATLAHSPAESELVDAEFRRWILGEELAFVPTPSDDPVVLEMGDDGDIETDDRGGSSDDHRAVRFSRAEVLADRDLASLDDDERAEIDRMVSTLRLRTTDRRSHRRRPVERHGDRLDLRRTVRASLRTEGEPFAIHTRDRVHRPRRLILLVDISGSMADYSRALVRFAHAAVRARSEVEVFAMGTRLTRLTRALDTHDPDRALADAAAVVADWSGGTRLGEDLERFNDEWGTRGMARGAVVVILSDGWDRGSPDLVAEQMARLARVAHRIVWVNPLKASPGYAPLARGMAAAMPFIDDFVEGHSFASLDRLAGLVASAGSDRTGGRPLEAQR